MSHWLLLEYPGNAPVRLDARILDRVLTSDEDLVLDLADWAIGLPIASGAGGAIELAAALAPYTRSAPLTKREAYEYALVWLELADGRRDRLPAAVFVGDKPLWASGDDLLLDTSVVCSVLELVHKADANDNIRTAAGWLQARVALFTVAQNERPFDDAEALRRRVADYERDHIGPRLVR